MKIVVAGPAHSGKSVFLTGLTSLLSRESHYLFRACPDGEGAWTYTSPEASKFRRKGQFSEEIVNWYCQVLEKNNLAPIVLVDIGGKITPENRRILVEGKVDAGIILSGDINAIPEWEQFLQECEVEVLAKIYSNYNATEDIVEGDILQVHHLERGEDVSSRPTIIKIAEMLNMIVEKINFPKQEVFEISNLARLIGKKEEEKTLPNGKVIKTINWVGEDLKTISRFLHNRSGQFKSPVKINGGMPGFLAAAIVHELHPCEVEINSPDGYVRIGCQDPSDTPSGENLQWKTETREDGWIVVTCEQKDPSIPLNPADLPAVTPPAVPYGSKVILSGRMPLWLVASIAMSYHGKTAAIAVFQPGGPAGKPINTVVITHTASVELGLQF